MPPALPLTVLTEGRLPLPSASGTTTTMSPEVSAGSMGDVMDDAELACVPVAPPTVVKVIATAQPIT